MKGTCSEEGECNLLLLSILWGNQSQEQRGKSGRESQEAENSE